MRAAQGQVAKTLEQFGYVERRVEESDGKVKSRETYEVTYYKDRRIRRMIEKDGKALTGAALEKENKRVEKLVTQLEKGAAPPLDNRRLRLQDLIRTSEFSKVRVERIQGRDLIACEFHPHQGFKPANMNERLVHSLDGNLWIDERGSQIAKAGFVLRDAFKVAGGLFFSMNETRHAISGGRHLAGQYRAAA